MNKNKKIINIAEVFRMNFPKSSLIFLPKNKNKQITKINNNKNSNVQKIVKKAPPKKKNFHI